ncbi:MULTISPECIES: glycosyltransferase family 2 protein [Butyricimonas]|jgi:glycosyltransferase, group 2 family protein|uniref:Cellulose synthase/poly-beta-1,6-N-acetylglucosamine synthase-like glycosyltransferase n=1 Tax=Butyricimonas faecihominis TaxID=1472416 RepID=A0A7W6MZR3_9BACT|nr:MULTISPECIES: glycosyltransferase family 2 protein [Butyricimonas]MBS6687757.1 glycosyltransferase [Sanguibacteroides justesenii]OKZ17363.1 MAG: glycosyl transferase [Butyricimonas synergistica]KAB1504765.1 glycosyltransferase [Butyricimonas faecihominis]MBB4027155.1 cellulose synthase/poly-beta-1,6-N-acetylglucosamine synthase-like glycosyltransferase [Butyricimonas faecihominis]WOF07485.1 glycosyltransferase [Butyricimonas faecihominis]
MNIQEALYIFEYICWILASVAVAYPLIYSLASLGTRKSYYPTANKQHKFAILFPAYKEDRVILPVVESFLQQHYPQELYKVIVISDHMQETTNERLAQLPITLLKANYENSSKAKALNFAMDHFERDEFDAVVILDADNIVDTNFLLEINKVFDAGVQAIQAHRTAKNRNTDIAVLDGLSEEVNNSIFRRGHVRLGISSALIGSGMIFNYQWFHDNVKHLVTTGEDKELEVLLLKQRIFIEFLDEVYVYDEKTQGEKGFYNQRRRWLATQFAQWGRVFKDLPQAILSGNIDYSDKLIQWVLPPRLILFGGIIVMGSIMQIIDWPLALKWWALFLIMGVTLCLAIPDKLVDDRFKKSINKLPLLFIMMVVNLFRMKGMNKKFVNTEKNGSSTL